MKNLLFVLVALLAVACMKNDVEVQQATSFSDVGVTSLCKSPSGASIPCIYLSDWQEYEADKPIWKYITLSCRAPNDYPGLLCIAGPNGDCRHLFSCTQCANCAEY